MTGTTYVETSALAKWYLNEPRSEEFASYMTRLSSVLTSRIALAEMRCLVARRRRGGEISMAIEREVLKTLAEDVRAGHLRAEPLTDAQLWRAMEVLEQRGDLSLGVLEALHLAVALETGCGEMATADGTLAQAAAALGIATVRFG